MNQAVTENKPILSKEEKINIFMSLFIHSFKSILYQRTFKRK